MSIVFTIIIFSILIIVHEFGHFIVAKRSGVRVEQFAIGFGPPLVRIKGKETDFSIRLIPLGGYVKLAGDNRAEQKGAKDEFLSQPVGIKARIVFAGPLFNYILAFVIFCIIAFIGFPHPDNTIGEVVENYPAQQAGLQKGDEVLEVNNVVVDNWVEMAKVIYKAKEKVSLKVNRDGKILYIDVPLKKKQITDDFGRKKNVSVIGVTASSKVEIVKYGFPKAIFKGLEYLLNLTVLVIKGFIFTILGVVPFKEAVAGPVGIYYIASEAVKIGIIATLHLMAVLNVSLAIVNLFPLPILDGGHILFFLIEKIRKKPLSEKTEDRLTKAGLALILLLIAFIFYNDIVRFGPKILNKEKQQSENQEVQEPEAQEP